mgnify:CR=1 FL=1
MALDSFIGLPRRGAFRADRMPTGMQGEASAGGLGVRLLAERAFVGSRVVRDVESQGGTRLF